MSTYQTAESALLAHVRAYAGGTVYRNANSGVDYWRALDAPNADAAVVEMTRPTLEGDRLNGYGGEGAYQELHTFAVWVVQKRGQGKGGDAAQKGNIKAQTEAVKDYLRAAVWDAPVVTARIIETSAPGQIAPSSDPEKATHWGQQIIIQVHCEDVLP